jgi:hypothetical protein
MLPLFSSDLTLHALQTAWCMTAAIAALLGYLWTCRW